MSESPESGGEAPLSGMMAPLDVKIKRRDTHSEKPMHRAVAALLLQNYTQTEIARILDVSVSTVHSIYHSERCQRILSEEYAKHGRVILEQLFAGEAVTSFNTLVELRDSSENEEIKYKCSKDILDRVLGKPVTRSENLNVERTLDIKTVDQLEAEILELSSMESKMR